MGKAAYGIPLNFLGRERAKSQAVHITRPRTKNRAILRYSARELVTASCRAAAQPEMSYTPSLGLVTSRQVELAIEKVNLFQRKGKHSLRFFVSNVRILKSGEASFW